MVLMCDFCGSQRVARCKGRPSSEDAVGDGSDSNLCEGVVAEALQCVETSIDSVLVFGPE